MNWLDPDRTISFALLVMSIPTLFVTPTLLSFFLKGKVFQRSDHDNSQCNFGLAIIDYIILYIT